MIGTQTLAIAELLRGDGAIVEQSSPLFVQCDISAEELTAGAIAPRQALRPHNEAVQERGRPI